MRETIEGKGIGPKSIGGNSAKRIRVFLHAFTEPLKKLRKAF